MDGRARGGSVVGGVWTRAALRIIILFAVPILFTPPAAANPGGDRKSPVDQWVTLSGCRLLPNTYNDGDSYHVTHGGKEYLFRLCYVDTPETTAHRELVERTSDQAKYWNILKRDLYVLADNASAFSTAQLAKPFTIMTRWEDARGASQLPRYFAIVRTAGGDDLGELLVAHGLARIYGYNPEHPGNKSPDTIRKNLQSLEAKAKASQIGAWAFSRGSSKKLSESKSTRSEPPKAKPKPTPVSEKKRSIDSLPAY